MPISRFVKIVIFDYGSNRSAFKIERELPATETQGRPFERWIDWKSKKPNPGM
jgi:hypothetical protein